MQTEKRSGRSRQRSRRSGNPSAPSAGWSRSCSGGWCTTPGSPPKPSSSLASATPPRHSLRLHYVIMHLSYAPGRTKVMPLTQLSQYRSPRSSRLLEQLDHGPRPLDHQEEGPGRHHHRPGRYQHIRVHLPGPPRPYPFLSWFARFHLYHVPGKRNRRLYRPIRTRRLYRSIRTRQDKNFLFRENGKSSRKIRQESHRFPSFFISTPKPPRDDVP